MNRRLREKKRKTRLFDDSRLDFDEAEFELSAQYLANTGLDLGAGFKAGSYYTKLYQPTVQPISKICDCLF